MEKQFTVRIAGIEDPCILEGINGMHPGVRVTFEMGFGEIDKYSCAVFLGGEIDAADYVRVARHFFCKRLDLFLKETKDWELSDDEAKACFRG